MKKKVGIVIFLLLILIGGIILFRPNNSNLERIYLTEKYYTEEAQFTEITKNQLEELQEENYILYIYNSYCKFPVSCDSIFEKFMKNYQISFLSLPFAEFRETSFYPEVKYAPSLIIIEKGKIISYLDANLDDDIEKYQNVDKLKAWLEQYIYLSK